MSPRPQDIPPRSLLMILLIVGVALTACVVPGVYVVDEINYIVSVKGLANGTLFVPGTEDFPPSRELYGFDPEPHRRTVTSTPVFSLVGPLYGFIAYPFYPLGWRGLVAINTLGFLVACLLVFYAVQSLTVSASGPDRAVLPWMAFAVFLLGGFSLEYAVGLWPHMLAVGLTTGSAAAAIRARLGGGWGAPLLAGLLAGLAIGIREQNIAIAAGVGAGLLIWGPRRWRAILLFAAGLAVPVIVAYVVNGLRIGFWTPLPKSASYAVHIAAPGADLLQAVVRRCVAFAAKTINFSWFPAVDDPIKADLLTRDSATGAYTTMGVVKKALLQSAPWMAPAMAWMVVSWWRKRGEDWPVTRELRALSLVVLPVFALSLAVGPKNFDGWAFNQRYFLELVPLGAIALGLGLQQKGVEVSSLGAGFVAGILVTLAVMAVPDISVRRYAIVWLPLVLAVVGCVVLPGNGMRHSRLIGGVVGVLVAWSFLVHIGGDMLHSGQRRSANAGRARVLEEVVPSRSALFTWWGWKDAAGSLLLEKDMVLLDSWADAGADAPMLVDSALARGRRVIVLPGGFPRAVLDSMTAGKTLEVLNADNIVVWEIRNSAHAPPARR